MSYDRFPLSKTCSEIVAPKTRAKRVIRPLFFKLNLRLTYLKIVVPKAKHILRIVVSKAKYIFKALF